MAPDPANPGPQDLAVKERVEGGSVGLSGLAAVGLAGLSLRSAVARLLLSGLAAVGLA
ncbi:hypothetical protein HMPREF1549_02209, partial [Actinomyces johnsonii F0510]